MPSCWGLAAARAVTMRASSQGPHCAHSPTPTCCSRRERRGLGVTSSQVRAGLSVRMYWSCPGDSGVFRKKCFS